MALLRLAYETWDNLSSLIFKIGMIKVPARTLRKIP